MGFKRICCNTINGHWVNSEPKLVFSSKHEGVLVFTVYTILAAGPGPNTATETEGGQFDDREPSAKVIYGGSNQCSDFRDN